MLGFRTRGPRSVEFCTDGAKFTAKSIGPVAFLIARLLSLAHGIGSLPGFRNCGPRRLEFRTEGAKFAAKSIGPVAFFIERLLVLDLRLGRLHGSQVGIDPRRIEFTRKDICPVPLLIKCVALLDPRRFSR